MAGVETLADALPKEIARVTAKKERWLKMQWEHNLGPGMQLSINIMQVHIEAAAQALASGDIVQMMQALQNLKDYNDDD